MKVTIPSKQKMGCHMTAIDLCFGLHIRDMKDSFDFYLTFLQTIPFPCIPLALKMVAKEPSNALRPTAKEIPYYEKEIE